MIFRFLRTVTYGFGDMVFSLFKLVQRQEQVLGSDIFIFVPDQDIFIYLDGLVVVTRLDMVSGLILYLMKLGGIFFFHIPPARISKLP